VLSGAIKRRVALTIRATRAPPIRAYAKIMEVMRESEARRPQVATAGRPPRRDLHAVALDGRRPRLGHQRRIDPLPRCARDRHAVPLLIAIPIAIIGSISLCARRAIIVKAPWCSSQIAECRTAIFDKTGTLTYGEPKLTEQLIAPGFAQKEVLTARREPGTLLETSAGARHPRGGEDGIARASRSHGGERTNLASDCAEPFLGRQCRLRAVANSGAELAGADQLPPVPVGLECVVAIDQRYRRPCAFAMRRGRESRSFVNHLGPKHHFARSCSLGDRESEVRYLAEQVGITEIHAQQRPGRETRHRPSGNGAAKTLYVAMASTTAPAMMAATVAWRSDRTAMMTAEAAGVVVMDNSLNKVDEFMHISRRCGLSLSRALWAAWR